MLGSAILATLAVAQEAQTKPAAKPEQTALSKEYSKKIDAVLVNATLWGSNTINGDAYVQAYNTSTGQTYYMTIYRNNSTSISLPAGNYNISVNTGSIYCNMYVSNLNNYVAYNKYYWTFYNIDITSSPSTVVSVTYS